MSNTISRTIKTKVYTVTYVTPEREFYTTRRAAANEKEARKLFEKECTHLIFSVELAETIEERYEMPLERFISNSEKLDKPDPNKITKTVKTCAYNVRLVNRETEEFTTVAAHFPPNATDRDKLQTLKQYALEYAIVRTERNPAADIEELRGMDESLFIALAELVED